MQYNIDQRIAQSTKGYQLWLAARRSRKTGGESHGGAGLDSGMAGWLGPFSIADAGVKANLWGRGTLHRNVGPDAFATPFL